MRKRVKPKLLADRSVHIDPLHCGSTIGYRLSISRYNSLSMAVRLASCDKLIQWDFDDYTDGTVEKFDEAISMLQEARRIWVKELAAHMARKKKK